MDFLRYSLGVCFEFFFYNFILILCLTVMILPKVCLLAKNERLALSARVENLCSRRSLHSRRKKFRDLFREVCMLKFLRHSGIFFRSLHFACYDPQTLKFRVLHKNIPSYVFDFFLTKIFSLSFPTTK